MIAFFEERRQAAQVLAVANAFADTAKELSVMVNKALRAKDVADSLQKGKRDKILEIMLED